jgi:hypothetical protein
LWVHLFNTRNIPEQSRWKYTAGAKESEEKPRQKKEIIQIHKSHHVMQPTHVNHKEGMQMADTATSTVIIRNQGIVQVHTVGPQEAVEIV